MTTKTKTKPVAMDSESARRYRVRCAELVMREKLYGKGYEANPSTHGNLVGKVEGDQRKAAKVRRWLIEEKLLDVPLDGVGNELAGRLTDEALRFLDEEDPSAKLTAVTLRQIAMVNNPQNRGYSLEARAFGLPWGLGLTEGDRLTDNERLYIIRHPEKFVFFGGEWDKAIVVKVGEVSSSNAPWDRSMRRGEPQVVITTAAAHEELERSRRSRVVRREMAKQLQGYLRTVLKLTPEHAGVLDTGEEDVLFGSRGTTQQIGAVPDDWEERMRKGLKTAEEQVAAATWRREGLRHCLQRIETFGWDRFLKDLRESVEIDLDDKK